MSSILIKAGVALDRDVFAQFSQIPKAAKEATKATDAVMKEAARALKLRVAEEKATLKEALREIQRHEKAKAKAVADGAAAVAKAEKAADAAVKSKAKQRHADAAAALARDLKMVKAHMADEERVAKQKLAAHERYEEKRLRQLKVHLEREAQVQRRADELAARQAKSASHAAEMAAARDAKAAEHRAKAFRRDVGRGLARGASLAMRAAQGGRELLEATGADFSVAGAMGRSANQSRAAAMLSNQAYIAGDARNGSRVDGSTLLSEARKVGNDVGESPDVALEGMSKFVAKTGDLATIRPIMTDLARLSKAFGTDLSDMADAAADVSNALGDMPDKGPAIMAVMNNIAAQGKLGAVEVKDMAAQMAKVAATAAFWHNSQGKGVAGNIESLTALAELAKMHGGAATPIQAATSVQSFANQFQKGARLGNMENIIGHDAVFAGDGKFKDPAREIIPAMLAKTKGDLTKLDPMIKDAHAKKVTIAAAHVYTTEIDRLKRTGEAKEMTPEQLNDAGIKAYLKELDKLTSATIHQREINESLSRVSEDSLSAAQRFNNHMDVFGDNLAEKATKMLAGLEVPITRMATIIGNAADQIFNTPFFAALRKADKATKTSSEDVTVVDNAVNDLKDKTITPERREQILKSLGEMKPKIEADIKNVAASTEELGGEKGKTGWGDAIQVAGEWLTKILQPVTELPLLLGGAADPNGLNNAATRIVNNDTRGLTSRPGPGQYGLPDSPMVARDSGLDQQQRWNETFKTELLASLKSISGALGPGAAGPPPVAAPAVGLSGTSVMTK